MNYETRFGNTTIEQKRKDLLIHPFVDHEAIGKATDEEVEAVHMALFTAMDNAMQDVIGESMFDDDDWL